MCTKVGWDWWCAVTERGGHKPSGSSHPLASGLSFLSCWTWTDDLPVPLTRFYKLASRHLHTDHRVFPRGEVSGLMYSFFMQVSAATSLPGGENLGPDLIRVVTRTGGSGCLEAGWPTQSYVSHNPVVFSVQPARSSPQLASVPLCTMCMIKN